jgi:hypothetical protein
MRCQGGKFGESHLDQRLTIRQNRFTVSGSRFTVIIEGCRMQGLGFRGLQKCQISGSHLDQRFRREAGATSRSRTNAWGPGYHGVFILHEMVCCRVEMVLMVESAKQNVQLVRLVLLVGTKMFNWFNWFCWLKPRC